MNSSRALASAARSATRRRDAKALDAIDDVAIVARAIANNHASHDAKKTGSGLTCGDSRAHVSSAVHPGWNG